MFSFLLSIINEYNCNISSENCTSGDSLFTTNPDGIGIYFFKFIFYFLFH
jgi:hypothetical protein